MKHLSLKTLQYSGETHVYITITGNLSLVKLGKFYQENDI